ncbi:helix-turn-helix domain-containing protein [Lactococcus lactis]|uniref:helix-turn-helix domain-containing protein n=1 Tax=Lactococcus lactis TaxID=1358 RepID=UPI0015CF2D0E|nr:AraC family transcriptional regulator [Lactococcus lactis]
MNDTLDLLIPFIGTPFAIFENNICIFSSEIENNYLLKHLKDNLCDETEKEQLTILKSNNYTSVTMHFDINHVDYFLISRVSSKLSEDWTSKEWSIHYKKVEVLVSTLKDSTTYKIKKIDNIEGYKNQIAFAPPLHPIATTLDLQHDYLDNYNLEQHIVNLLKENNPTAIRPLFKTLIRINDCPLSEDNLRDKKYKLTSLISVLAREAIKNNSPINLAYRLSNHLILKLDKVDNIKLFSGFLNYLFVEFSHLFNFESKRYPSNTVNLAIKYIQNHLYDSLSNSEIADYLFINPSYLSHLFKKTTDTSLRSYIAKQKINEAKHLLLSTDFSLSYISELLHFSSQSRFTKIFKEVTGYTPKSFRMLF